MDDKKDFNYVVNETIKLLKKCYRDDAGHIYWHEGTAEKLFEVLTYLPDAKEYIDERHS